MALTIADTILIDFAFARYQERNDTDKKSPMASLADIAKELNRVFEAKEREDIVKRYALKKLFLFNEAVLAQHYDVDFTHRVIRQKNNSDIVLDMMEIYEECNESLKSIGSNVKLFKTA